MQNNNKNLFQSQYGFRKKTFKHTSDYITMTKILQVLDNKEYKSGLLFLDLAKAFDTVTQ